MRRLVGHDIDPRILVWADEVYKENEPYRRATKGGTGHKDYTTGDLLYASSTQELSKLGIGSSTQLLGVSGGVPAWTTPKNRGWELITDTTLGSAAASITVSGLAGDTDEFYRFDLYVIGAVISTAIYIRPNNDSTASNYRYQYLQGTNISTAAARADTTEGLVAGQTAAVGDLSLSTGIIYAKSGKRRLCMVRAMENINATSQEVTHWNNQWKNTADEITSLVFRCNTAGSPLDAGTRLRLWKAVTT